MIRSFASVRTFTHGLIAATALAAAWLGFQSSPAQAQGGIPPACIQPVSVVCTGSQYTGQAFFNPGDTCLDVQLTAMFPATPCTWTCVKRFRLFESIGVFSDTNLQVPGFQDGDVVGQSMTTMLDSDTLTTRVITLTLVYNEGLPGLMAPWVAGLVQGGNHQYGPLYVRLGAREFPTETVFDFSPEFESAVPPGTALASARVHAHCLE